MMIFTISITLVMYLVAEKYRRLAPSLRRPKNDSSRLADLYDPRSVSDELGNGHAELDRAVEKCYRRELFASDRERVEFLFACYGKLANPLTAEENQKRRRNAEAKEMRMEPLSVPRKVHWANRLWRFGHA